MPVKRHRLKSHVLKRFELYIAGLGAAFAAVIGAVVLAEPPALVVVAVTAGGMGVIQGAILWAGGERSRRLRAQVVHEVREMLTDQVLNQLAAMKMWVAERPDPRELELVFEETDASIDQVAAMVEGLSEDRLDTWRLQYANVADNLLTLPEA